MTLATLAEDQGLDPSTHIQAHNHLQSSSRGSSTFFCPLWAPGTRVVHIHTTQAKLSYAQDKNKSQIKQLHTPSRYSSGCTPPQSPTLDDLACALLSILKALILNTWVQTSVLRDCLTKVWSWPSYLLFLFLCVLCVCINVCMYVCVQANVETSSWWKQPSLITLHLTFCEGISHSPGGHQFCSAIPVSAGLVTLLLYLAALEVTGESKLRPSCFQALRWMSCLHTFCTFETLQDNRIAKLLTSCAFSNFLMSCYI